MADDKNFVAPSIQIRVSRLENNINSMKEPLINTVSAIDRLSKLVQSLQLVVADLQHRVERLER